MADELEEIRRRSEVMVASMRTSGRVTPARQTGGVGVDPVAAAAHELGGPLSMADYQTWRERQEPRPESAWTLARRHGGWPAACRAAGVKAKGETYRRWTRADHLDAVRAAAADVGEPLTATVYEAWRSTRRKPRPTLDGYGAPEWLELCRQAGVEGATGRST